MGRLKAMCAEMDLNTLSSNIFVQGPDVPPALLYPEALPFGADGDVSHWARDSWVDETRALLEERNIEYDLSDEYIADERLAAYDVVFASAWQCMAAGLQERLARHAGQVVVGPHLPDEDEWLRPCTTLAAWAGEGPQNLHLCGQVSPALLEELGLRAECTCSSGQLELSLHHGAQHQVLFVANPGGQACEATITLPGRRNMYDEDGALVAKAASLQVAMPAHTVRLWRLEKGVGE